jgi:8-amino-3,8-dideoxy-alpha-D-manno-octulosonate transaminase
MPGFELFGEEERQAINEIFDNAGGIVFAHGFDAMRNGHYKVREFEKAFADKLGVKHAQAVSSGTAALKVGLQSLGVGPGDEVITQAFTFVATVEAIRETGAMPVVVDVNDTLNMDPESFRSAITPKTKVVLPVHMMGECAEMDEIMAIAKQHNILVMEDAAQALGSSYFGRNAGTMGVVGAYSTDAGKSLNTGEGGLVVTNDEQRYVLARGLHDHGHEYSKTKGRGEEGAICFGFNFRMTEMQGAIGVAQLKKLDFIVTRQRENKAKLMQKLQALPVTFRRSADPNGDLGDTIVFYLPDRERAEKFVAGMRAKGLGTKNLPDAIGWHFAKHWSHVMDGNPRYEGKCETAWTKSADLLERSVAIPVMVKMDDARIEHVASTLIAVGREVL